MHHLILQIDTLRQGGGAVERFFHTSPDTVFGLLTGALAMGVVALWVAYIRQTSAYTKDLRELHVANNKALGAVASALDRIRDTMAARQASISEDFDRLREYVGLLLKKDKTLEK